MSNIDKQALRQTAEKAQEHGVFNMDIHSQTVLALLDELEAKDKRIAELSVPDEATPENIEILASTFAPRGVTYQWDKDECNAATDSWNACRAAMLQSFGNSEQLNSPVIPDGWVACSEQMPKENAEQEVLACFKGGDISTLYYFEGRWDDAYGIVPIRQDVTHWMPLPAAPQQEVK